MEQTKTTQKTTTVCLQIRLITLLALKKSSKAKNEGVRVDDILKELSGNEKLWLEREQGKNWEARIDFALSNLYNEGIIDKRERERSFIYKQQEGNNELTSLAKILIPFLELEVSFGENELLLTIEEKLNMIAEGDPEVDISSLRSNLNKEGKQVTQSILTFSDLEQLVELALLLELDI